MATNPTSTLLKAILVVCVLTLIMGVAVYMKASGGGTSALTGKSIAKLVESSLQANEALAAYGDYQMIPPGVLGTDMTKAQMAVFFSNAYTATNFPQNLWCKNVWGQYPGAYHLFYNYFTSAQGQSVLPMLVTRQEQYKYDVPSVAWAQAHGQLTPMCK